MNIIHTQKDVLWCAVYRIKAHEGVYKSKKKAENAHAE